MAEQRAYSRWQRRHPRFDLQDYAQWVKARGYYRAALDITKAEFYEYASMYLQHCIARQAA